jgi:hypothetical protein
MIAHVCASGHCTGVTKKSVGPILKGATFPAMKVSAVLFIAFCTFCMSGCIFGQTVSIAFYNDTSCNTLGSLSPLNNYDILQYFVLAKEEVIFVRYALAKGETRRHQCNC